MSQLEGQIETASKSDVSDTLGVWLSCNRLEVLRDKLLEQGFETLEDLKGLKEPFSFCF